MRLKDGLIVREVAGQFVIVPTGKRVQEIHGVLYMNRQGRMLWSYMADREFTEEDLTDYLQKSFPEVSRERAEQDAKAFVTALSRENLLEKSGGSGRAQIWISRKKS